jgi:hypothetical protein
MAHAEYSETAPQASERENIKLPKKHALLAPLKATIHSKSGAEKIERESACFVCGHSWIGAFQEGRAIIGQGPQR